MLICRESLWCGGRAAEGEPRSCHLMYLWTQNEAKGVSSPPPPPHLLMLSPMTLQERSAV